MSLLFVNCLNLEIPSAHQYMDGKLFILGVMAHAGCRHTNPIVHDFGTNSDVTLDFIFLFLLLFFAFGEVVC